MMLHIWFANRICVPNFIHICLLGFAVHKNKKKKKKMMMNKQLVPSICAKQYCA